MVDDGCNSEFDSGVHLRISAVHVLFLLPFGFALGSVLGSVWAPFWGSFSALLAPWSVEVGPRAPLEPIYAP